MEMVDITHCLIISKSIGIRLTSFGKLQHEEVFHGRVSVFTFTVVLDLGYTLASTFSFLLSCQRTIAFKKNLSFGQPS